MVIDMKSVYDKIKENLYSKKENNRHSFKVWVCTEVCTEEELKSLSSINTAFVFAREKILENVVKESDPELYYKVKTSDNKVPIFNLAEYVEEYKKKISNLQ